LIEPDAGFPSGPGKLGGKILDSAKPDRRFDGVSSDA